MIQNCCVSHGPATCGEQTPRCATTSSLCNRPRGGKSICETPSSVVETRAQSLLSVGCAANDHRLNMALPSVGSSGCRALIQVPPPHCMGTIPIFELLPGLEAQRIARTYTSQHKHECPQGSRQARLREVFLRHARGRGGRVGGVAGQVARRALPGIEFGFRPIPIGGVLALLGSTAPGFDSPRQLPSHLRRYHLLSSPSSTSSTALAHPLYILPAPLSSTRPLSPTLGVSPPFLVPPGPPTCHSVRSYIFIYVAVEQFSVLYYHRVSVRLRH